MTYPLASTRQPNTPIEWFSVICQRGMTDSYLYRQGYSQHQIKQIKKLEHRLMIHLSQYKGEVE